MSFFRAPSSSTLFRTQSSSGSRPGVIPTSVHTAPGSTHGGGEGEKEPVVNFRRRRTVTFEDIVNPTPAVPRKRRPTIVLDSSFDIIQILQQSNAIEQVKAAFATHGDAVCKERFCTVMKDTLALPNTPSSDDDLEKLFYIIDAKSEGVISWDDFTTYCVDSAILTKISTELAENLGRWELDFDVYTVASHRPWKIKPISNSTQGDFFIVDASSALFAMNNRMEATKIPVSSAGTIIDAEYIPFEDIFCLATAASELLLCNPEATQTEVHKVPTSIQCLTWNKPSQLLCSGDRAGMLGLWVIERTPTDKIKQPHLQHSWQLHSAPILTIAVHRALGTLVVGSLDGVVTILHPVTGRRERVFSLGSGGLNALAVSEHQNAVVVGGCEPVPMLWALTNCEESKPFSLNDRVTPHSGPIVSIITFPDSAQCMTLDFTGVLKVWDLRTYSCLQSFACRMRDMKVCWNSLALSANGTRVFACDRKNLFRLRPVDEDEQHVARGAVVAVGCSPIANRIISVHLSLVRLWHDKAGTMAGEVALSTKEEVTAALMDEAGGRIFVGNSRGAMFVYNANTAGLVARFPKAHKTEVVAITFITHANVAMSCSDDGEGSLLKPPSLGVQNDALFSRVQAGFRCMTGRLCLYVGGEAMVILAADEDLRINVYDSKCIKATAALVNLATVPFGPKIERLSRSDKNEEQVVSPLAKVRRYFSCGVALHTHCCAIVADSNTLGMLHIARSRCGGPVLLMRWGLDPGVDGPAVISMAVIPTHGGAVDDSTRFAVGDDSGKVTVFDVSEVIEAHRISGQNSQLDLASTASPVALFRRNLFFGTVVSLSYHIRLDRIAVGFAEGTVACYSCSFQKIWDSTIKTKSVISALFKKKSEEEEEEDEEGLYPGFIPDILSSITDPQQVAKKKSELKKQQGEGGLTRGMSFGGFLSKTVSDFTGSQFKGKRIHRVGGDPAWVRHQLSTLCGEGEAKTYSQRKVERPAFVTPKMRISVFMDIDHSAVCVSADGPEEVEDSGFDTRQGAESDSREKHHDALKSLREKYSVPDYTFLKKFIGKRTEDFPPLSLPKTREAVTVPPTCLLRPLSRSSPLPSGSSAYDEPSLRSPAHAPSLESSLASLPGGHRTPQRAPHQQLASPAKHHRAQTPSLHISPLDKKLRRARLL